MKKIILILLVILVIFVVVFFIINNPNRYAGDYLEYVETMDSFQSLNGSIRYLDKGNGPAILLVHGIPTSSWMYKDLSNTLINKGFRVIAPDMLGFGASDRPNLNDYTEVSVYDFDKQASVLVDLMEYLNISEWSMVLHDMGSLVGYEILKQKSEKIIKIIMLDSIVYPETFVKIPSFSLESGLDRFKLSLIESKLISPLIIKSTLFKGSPNYEWTDEEIAGYVYPYYSVVGGKFAYTHFFGILNQIQNKLQEYRQLFTKNNTPLFVIWGSDDPFLDGKTTIDMLGKESLSNLSTEIIPAGHFIAVESPETLADLIYNFIQINPLSNQ
jgi:haloalkane dehalogenase